MNTIRKSIEVKCQACGGRAVKSFDITVNVPPDKEGNIKEIDVEKYLETLDGTYPVMYTRLKYDCKCGWRGEDA